MNDNFEAIKTEILDRAKKANACREQYGRAYKSTNTAELLTVVKDNFNWAYRNKVLTVDLIERYRDEFAASEIYANVSVTRGYLLCDSATVKAYGSATVKAYGSATVKAYDSATVEAYGSATVKAYGSATVKAYGSATVEAYDSAYVQSYLIIECKLSDNAIYRIRSINEIRYASDCITFKRQ